MHFAWLLILLGCTLLTRYPAWLAFHSRLKIGGNINYSSAVRVKRSVKGQTGRIIRFRKTSMISSRSSVLSWAKLGRCHVQSVNAKVKPPTLAISTAPNQRLAERCHKVCLFYWALFWLARLAQVSLAKSWSLSQQTLVDCTVGWICLPSEWEVSLKDTFCV